MPDIERLIINMKSSRIERKAALGYIYKTDALLRKIQDGSQMGAFRFRNGTVADSKDLAGFLYKINFLTARKELPDGDLGMTGKSTPARDGLYKQIPSTKYICSSI